MKILLDECVDRRLARDLPGHFVKTAPQMSWASLKNGRLLGLAHLEFDIFLTVDSNLKFQQNLSQFEIAVIVLATSSNRLTDLRAFVPEILRAIPIAKKGEAIVISGPQ
ncbi:MAG: hypothetical protein ABIQ35_05745 [Verrucomicrobiota bacterium]